MVYNFENDDGDKEVKSPYSKRTRKPKKRLSKTKTTRNIILSEGRKTLIRCFRSGNRTDIGTWTWFQQLHEYMADPNIEIKDIVRWSATHTWITGPAGAPVDVEMPQLTRINKVEIKDNIKKIRIKSPKLTNRNLRPRPPNIEVQNIDIPKDPLNFEQEYPTNSTAVSISTPQNNCTAMEVEADQNAPQSQSQEHNNNEQMIVDHIHQHQHQHQHQELNLNENYMVEQNEDENQISLYRHNKTRIHMANIKPIINQNDMGISNHNDITLTCQNSSFEQQNPLDYFGTTSSQQQQQQQPPTYSSNSPEGRLKSLGLMEKLGLQLKTQQNIIPKEVLTHWGQMYSQLAKSFQKSIVEPEEKIIVKYEVIDLED